MVTKNFVNIVYTDNYLPQTQFDWENGRLFYHFYEASTILEDRIFDRTIERLDDVSAENLKTLDSFDETILDPEMVKFSNPFSQS